VLHDVGGGSYAWVGERILWKVGEDFGRESENGVGMKNSESIMERQAHRFASAFLMPEIAWRSECRVVSLVRFKSLKPRWLTSIASMLQRALDLDLISKERFLSMRRQLSNNEWRTREPFDDIIPEEKPLLLSQASELLLKHGYFIPQEFSRRRENLSEITGLDIQTLFQEKLPIVFN
jgi:Zn-dependent peptidase ImmA (M78 family)